MDWLLITPLLLSFFLILLLMPFWIRKAASIGLIWKDMNKLGEKKVAGSGGIIVVLSFIVGLLLLIAYRTFIVQTENYLIELLALLVSLLILAGIGLIDDLLGWQRGGLSRRSRLVLVAFAAIPLMVINAGKSIISIPLIGQVDIGIFYPLILIPIGIVGATTTFNFLAGFNGLEAGQGILLLSALGLVSYFTGNPWLTFVSAVMISCLLAFLIFNFSPAKVFPGDTLTYTVGGLIAIIPILGNFEKIAVFFFIPYILEVFLKARGKLVKQSFGKPTKDNKLDLLYTKIYGLEHLSIYLLNKTPGKATEKKVVYLIWAFQLLIILIGFIIFRQGIF